MLSDCCWLDVPCLLIVVAARSLVFVVRFCSSMFLASCTSLSVGCYCLFVFVSVCCMGYAACCLLLAVSRFLILVYCFLDLVCCLLFLVDVRCSLFVVHCSLRVVCLLFVV